MSLQISVPIRRRATSWIAIPIAAVIRPSIEAYMWIADQARGSARSALTWIVLSGLLSSAMSLVDQPNFEPVQHSAVPLDGYLAAVALVTAIALLHWTLSFLSIQSAAQLLRGGGRYMDLAYLFAAISAPLTILASAISIATTNLFVIGALYIYWLGLYVTAVRAVNGFSVWRALASVFVGLAILGSLILGVIFLFGNV